MVFHTLIGVHTTKIDQNGVIHVYYQSQNPQATPKKLQIPHCLAYLHIPCMTNVRPPVPPILQIKTLVIFYQAWFTLFFLKVILGVSHKFQLGQQP